MEEKDVYNKSEMLLKYNPVHKKVPVLVHGEKPISESTVILEYIDEVWKQNPLLPDDPYQRAQARFWTKFGEDKSSTLFEFFTTDGEEQVKYTKEAREILKTIEEHGLGGKKFFGGSKIGLTDLEFGWIAAWLQVLEQVAGVKVLEADDCPNLKAWIRNFKEVPVIKENLPDQNRMLAYYKPQREWFISSKPT